MERRVCVDYRDGRYGWCFCRDGELHCVDLPSELAEKELGRGTPWCTKDFCKEGG